MSATKKRSNEADVNKKGKKNNDVAIEEEDFDNNDLVFEDPFGDEFEQEDIEDNNEMDEEDEEAEEARLNEEALKMEQEEIDRDNAAKEAKNAPKQVWRPGVDKLEEGETLEYDPSAYVMYHSLRTEWPCLSFDILKDNLGDNRLRFPMSMYMITGSQASQADKNKLTLLKLTELHKTQTVNEEDDESVEEDETLDEDPTIEHININHYGGVNRIRSMPQNPGVVLSMADTGSAHIYDLSTVYSSMQVNGPRATPPTKASYTFTGHKEEGYAVDWSLAVSGRAATGDCAGNIHIWNANGNSWSVDPSPYTGHKSSVEDIQWSPTEGTVFGSCSADKTIKIWDTRGRTGPQISFQAHNDDVNVMTWNRSVGYLLASGSDDGSFKVWDLRAIRKSNAPLANFTYHKGPITSIEWAPNDESVITVSSSDNQVTVWDLSVEADDAAPSTSTDPSLADFPPQLLFIHQGQMNVKEIHHHPQLPGVIVSTAEDCFNVFKPAINASS